MKFSIVASSFGNDCDPYISSLRNSVKSIYPQCKINIVGKDTSAPEEQIKKLREDIEYVRISPGSLKIICWNQGFKDADTEWVLFMDNDTALFQKIDDIIDLCEKQNIDFLFTWRHSKPQYINSGVMLVRKTKSTLEFFEKYEKNMLEDIKINRNDQDTFISLLNRSQKFVDDLQKEDNSKICTFQERGIKFGGIHCDHMNRSSPYSPWLNITRIQHFKGVQCTIITKNRKENRYDKFINNDIFFLSPEKINNLAFRINLYKHFADEKDSKEVIDIIEHYNSNINNFQRRLISETSVEHWQYLRIKNKIHIPKEPMDKVNAKNVLFEVDNILKKNKIDYFLSCGTALGFYRDGNFIEWDDEIDIDIYSEVLVPNIDMLKDRFIKEGFVVRMTKRGRTSKINVFKDKVKVAIGAIYDGGDGYRHTSGSKIPSKFYENFEQITFSKKAFKVPGPIEEYLEYYYGDWRKPVKSYDPNLYMNQKNELIK